MGRHDTKTDPASYAALGVLDKKELSARDIADALDIPIDKARKMIHSLRQHQLIGGKQTSPKKPVMYSLTIFGRGVLRNLRQKSACKDGAKRHSTVAPLTYRQQLMREILAENERKYGKRDEDGRYGVVRHAP